MPLGDNKLLPIPFPSRNILKGAKKFSNHNDAVMMKLYFPFGIIKLKSEYFRFHEKRLSCPKKKSRIIKLRTTIVGHNFRIFLFLRKKAFHKTICASRKETTDSTEQNSCGNISNFWRVWKIFER